MPTATIAPRRAPSTSRPTKPSQTPKPAAAPAEPKPNAGWSAAARTARVASAAPIKPIVPGPVNELEKMSAIVVANPDGFGPTTQLHQDIANNLPKGTQLVVVENKDMRGWGAPPPKGALRVPSTIDSPWARDFAPLFVRTPEGKLEVVEFKYGYPGSDNVAKAMGKKLGLPVRSSPLVLEGGNLLVDQGRLFVTSKLMKTNPGMTKPQIEAELKKTLHLKDIAWMEPLPGEPTGHIDMYAKLLAPNTMLVADTANPEQKKTMNEAARRFEALGYKVVRVTNAVLKPTDPKGQWEPARSYANALIVNGTAFVPQYAAPVDQQISAARAKAILGFDKAALAAFEGAGLKAVGVNAADLINFQGSVHCMTNTIPEEVKAALLK